MSDETPYIVSARKYRPATFRSVVGQKALTATLKNAIGSGRLAQAYLFCGPRGVGKTSCARIFAKTINCLSPTPDGEACGECESCRAIERGNSVNLVELDAASNNSVDAIREITDQVHVLPQGARYRVFIIDEVHMLSNSAFNAFLKTLEEPPKHVVFILATTEKHKVIPTILSRCQIYDFKRITVNDMVDHLEYVAQSEGIKAEREALGVIALKADGAMRDALSIFDQVSASSRGEVTYASTIENLNVLDHEYYFKLVDAFAKGDVGETLLLYKEIRDKGFDSLFFVNGLASHVRDLMVAAEPRTAVLLEAPDEVAGRYVAQARTLPAQWYYGAVRLLADCDYRYRTATGKRLLVELTLIRLCQLQGAGNGPFEDPDRLPPLGDPRSGVKAAANPAVTRTPGPQAPGPQAGVSPQTAGQSARVESPAPTPAPAGPRTPVQTEGTKRPRANRPSSFRLNENRTGVDAGAGTLRHRTSPFTLGQFEEAWRGFIPLHDELHLLVNGMRQARLSHDGGDTVRVVVDHPAQVEAFNSSMQVLLEYLRDKLDNDLVSLHVGVDPAKAGAVHLPPKELLRKVVSENPAMARFLTELDAELS